ncbi:MAG: elongation factor 1-beta [Thermofilum sp. ex4484_15]|nr:MAG: elongation factor 1-beta [Thermofilum sp. ex4484_15]
MVAKVAVLIRVFPESTETSLEELTDRIRNVLPSEYEIASRGEEPIAFGLKALLLKILMPEDKEGGTSELEEVISKVEGVSQVEVIMVSRSY